MNGWMQGVIFTHIYQKLLGFHTFPGIIDNIIIDNSVPWDTYDSR